MSNVPLDPAGTDGVNNAFHKTTELLTLCSVDLKNPRSRVVLGPEERRA